MVMMDGRFEYFGVAGIGLASIAVQQVPPEYISSIERMGIVGVMSVAMVWLARRNAKKDEAMEKHLADRMSDAEKNGQLTRQMTERLIEVLTENNQIIKECHARNKR
jgi:hypothetical protein